MIQEPVFELVTANPGSALLDFVNAGAAVFAASAAVWAVYSAGRQFRDQKATAKIARQAAYFDALVRDLALEHVPGLRNATFADLQAMSGQIGLPDLDLQRPGGATTSGMVKRIRWVRDALEEGAGAWDTTQGTDLKALISGAFQDLEDATVAAAFKADQGEEWERSKLDDVFRNVLERVYRADPLV